MISCFERVTNLTGGFESKTDPPVSVTGFLLQGRRKQTELIAQDIKQLLDEVEYDIMNYQNRGLCYLPKPKAEADNTDTRF